MFWQRPISALAKSSPETPWYLLALSKLCNTDVQRFLFYILLPISQGHESRVSQNHRRFFHVGESPILQVLGERNWNLCSCTCAKKSQSSARWPSRRTSVFWQKPAFKTISAQMLLRRLSARVFFISKSKNCSGFRCISPGPVVKRRKSSTSSVWSWPWFDCVYTTVRSSHVEEWMVAVAHLECFGFHIHIRTTMPLFILWYSKRFTRWPPRHTIHFPVQKYKWPQCVCISSLSMRQVCVRSFFLLSAYPNLPPSQGWNLFLFFVFFNELDVFLPMPTTTRNASRWTFSKGWISLSEEWRTHYSTLFSQLCLDQRSPKFAIQLFSLHDFQSCPGIYILPT